MTVCPKCNGRGTVGYYHIDHFVDIECDRCHGSGEVSEVEMTNEEWFCGLSTEEKAIWIERIMFIVRYRKEVEDGAYMQTITKKDYIEKWLKEIHHAE